MDFNYAATAIGNARVILSRPRKLPCLEDNPAFTTDDRVLEK
jgi:hypothetical protein